MISDHPTPERNPQLNAELVLHDRLADVDDMLLLWMLLCVIKIQLIAQAFHVRCAAVFGHPLSDQLVPSRSVL